MTLPQNTICPNCLSFASLPTISSKYKTPQSLLIDQHRFVSQPRLKSAKPPNCKHLPKFCTSPTYARLRCLDPEVAGVSRNWQASKAWEGWATRFVYTWDLEPHHAHPLHWIPPDVPCTNLLARHWVWPWQYWWDILDFPGSGEGKKYRWKGVDFRFFSYPDHRPSLSFSYPICAFL